MVLTGVQFTRDEGLRVTNGYTTVAKVDPTFGPKNYAFHIPARQNVRIIPSEQAALEGRIVSNKAHITLEEHADLELL